MERTRRLHEFWAWLPAFRAVAETEHLPTASASLHITPSALSRTVRLLEEAVGRPLFERSGGRLRLAPAGEAFLVAVRQAMRRVHEGLLEVEQTQHAGPVHLSITGPFVPLVILPVVGPLQRQAPGLTLCLTAHPGPEEANARLRQGAIDIAILDDPLPDDDLHYERLTTLRHDVCCAPGHPLLRADDREQQLRWAPFAAPRADAEGRRPDAWPVTRARRVALEVTVMQMAIDAVAAGSHVAALPVEVARGCGLVPLGVDDLPTTDLYLAQRRPLPGVVTRTELVAEAIRAHVSRAMRA
ncbi:MAG: LysR family transcriptional regulator [Sandaracinaceae bacterium]